MQHLKAIFQQAIQHYSQNTAVILPLGDKISYQQLFTIAQTIQQYLPQDQKKIIGILLPKSAYTIASIWALTESNHTYLPLDIHSPNVRNEFILKKTKASGIIITIKKAKEFLTLFPTAFFTPIPNLDIGYLQFNQKTIEIPSDLAYLLFTSGSTGKPKGVMITHENALSFIKWSVETFQYSTQDIFSSIAPFHFDLSVFDLYVSFYHGASLVLFNQKYAKNPMMVAEMMAAYRITSMYATPTLLTAMLNYGKLERYNHQSLRYVLFAGEVFPIQSLKKLVEQWRQADFYNLYGPTETNVCSFYKIPKEIIAQRKNPFPIGKPCSHCNLKIDNNQQQGELLVNGKAVMTGYWENPEATKKALVKDSKGRVWYRTGDIVKKNTNGNYEFIGRKDRMIKRRGYRIELAEVERGLGQHRNLQQVAVIAKKTAKKGIQIKAFYQKKENIHNNLSLLELKQHCLKFLPNYMIPDYFQEIEAIPQTSTHKIDYQMLEKID